MVQYAVSSDHHIAQYPGENPGRGSDHDCPGQHVQGFFFGGNQDGFPNLRTAVRRKLQRVVSWHSAQRGLGHHPGDGQGDDDADQDNAHQHQGCR
ncbi:hypothetical protein D3C87_1724050 [compost metagenome]